MSQGTNRVRSAALGLGALGSLALVGFSTWVAVLVPSVTDFAGFDSVVHASASHLGCVYVRPVQLAGARLVPGMVAPAAPGLLKWHFNEPLVLTYLVYPLSHLPLRAAVSVWLGISLAALAAAGAVLWRGRGPVPPLLAVAVVIALLGNFAADYNLVLAQNDALLLLVFVCAMAQLRRGRDLTAGALFGVVALKPQLVFLVFAVLVFQRRWRTAAAMAATGAALWSVCVAMAGPSCALTYLHSASELEEIRVGIGLPMSVSHLSGSVVPSEALFAVLCLCALALLWHVRKLDPDLALPLAVGCALVIGLHVLAYDVVFLAPLGMYFARRHPLAVFALGWVFSMAELDDDVAMLQQRSPVRLVEVAAVAAFAAAVIVLRRAEWPGTESGPSVAASPAVPVYPP